MYTNFIDTFDEQGRLMGLKAYLHHEQRPNLPSHGYSYLELRKCYMELNQVYLTTYIVEGELEEILLNGSTEDKKEDDSRRLRISTV